MSRHRSSGSQGHHVERLFSDCYRLSWTVDRYYPGVRLRFPRRCTRDTDTVGAHRFAKKWGVEVPPEPPRTCGDCRKELPGGHPNGYCPSREDSGYF